MKGLIRLAILITLFVGFGVIRSSHAQGQTMAAIIGSDSRFTQMRTALNTAGLYDMYNGTGPYTLFIPTDAALAAYDQATLQNQNQARQLILYHTLKGTQDSKTAWNLGTVQTALGKNVTFSNKDGKIYLNDSARVTMWDIKASNGIIHIVDAVVSMSNSAATAAGEQAAELPAGPPEPVDTPLYDPSGNPAYVSGGRMPHWQGIHSASHYCKAMTWVLLKQMNGVSLVGADRKTNPYRGDTSCHEMLPMLCIKQDHSAVPGGQYQDSWAFGRVRITAPVQGSQFTSSQAAHSKCAADFGEGWRMAEFHDAHFGQSSGKVSGWDFWAFGGLPTGQRFWVYNNDQPANFWNSNNPRVAPPTEGGAYVPTGGDPAFKGGMRPYWELIHEGRSSCKGTTFVILQQQNGLVRVGGDSYTNPFHGDTSCSHGFPVLCIRVDGFPAPADAHGNAYAEGWSGGWVRLSNPVSGSALSSREGANAVCSNTFGPAWRMAEWHDGNLGLANTEGQDFWAYGGLPTGSRFWVAVYDQSANPWNQ